MREVTDHKIVSGEDRLKIFAVDEPGAGGACHAYEVQGAAIDSNPSRPAHFPLGVDNCLILFQNGPIGEVGGVNGLTHEALLAIIADRLRSFQAGAYACTENANALRSVEAALSWLKSRTRARLARGVEGTHTV